MSNLDKLLLICIIGMIIGFIMIIIDVQKTAYNKGLRDGYHRGRSYKGQE
jgi:hypothetical protein